MSLQKEINGTPSPIFRKLKQKYATHADGALLTLIAGVTSKRIRIWRLLATVTSTSKSCQILSGTDPFITLYGQEHELKSSDGVPVFICNSGADFKADPSDATAWYYYVVYSIE